MDFWTEEQWKPIVGFEGLYSVSNLGRVRGEDRLDAAGRRWAGRPIKTSMRSGYVTVTLYKDGAPYSRQVHRLVLEAFIGPCPDGMEGCHDPDHTKTNNRLTNLRWGTKSDNAQDTLRHGRHEKASRTHCPRSHALITPNLIIANLKQGWRACLACDRARKWVRRHSGDEDLQTVSDRYYVQIMEKMEVATNGLMPD